jgi:hypothetical protein
MVAGELVIAIRADLAVVIDARGLPTSCFTM